MSQSPLLASRKKSLLNKAQSYAAGNLRAAKAILLDRARYERECPFLVKWAEAFQQRLTSEKAKAG